MAIITYTDIETHTRRTYSSADRTALGMLIGQVEAFVKWSVMDWSEASDTAQAYDGCGTRYLWLNRWLADLSSVTVDGVELDSSAYRLVNNICLYRKEYVWDEDEEIIVTGDWGFAAAGAPADFKALLVMIVTRCFEAYARKEVASESVGRVSFSYIQGQIGGSELLQALLRRYSALKVL